MDNQILILVLYVCSFLCGYAIGLMFPPQKKTEAAVKSNTIGEQTEIRLKEYKNFLSYDGTVQS